MDKPSVARSISKLVNAGESVGFTVEQMIELLEAGVTVLTLLDLIHWKLNAFSAARTGRPLSLGDVAIAAQLHARKNNLPEPESAG